VVDDVIRFVTEKGAGVIITANTEPKVNTATLDIIEKKWLCSSLLRWIQVAANKTYCLLCLPQTILCE
jgi:hypothetical protein